MNVASPAAGRNGREARPRLRRGDPATLWPSALDPLYQWALDVVGPRLPAAEVRVFWMIVSRTIRWRKLHESIPARHFLQGVIAADGQVLHPGVGFRDERYLRRILNRLKAQRVILTAPSQYGSLSYQINWPFDPLHEALTQHPHVPSLMPAGWVATILDHVAATRMTNTDALVALMQRFPDVPVRETDDREEVWRTLATHAACADRGVTRPWAPPLPDLDDDADDEWDEEAEAAAADADAETDEDRAQRQALRAYGWAVLARLSSLPNGTTLDERRRAIEAAREDLPDEVRATYDALRAEAAALHA